MYYLMLAMVSQSAPKTYILRRGKTKKIFLVYNTDNREGETDHVCHSTTFVDAIIKEWKTCNL